MIVVRVMQQPGGNTIVQGYRAMVDTKDLASKNNERGATILFFAFALVALIGIGALAVDIGMGLVVRSELQNASDAAALAGTRELAQYYKANPTKIEANITSHLDDIGDAAATYATSNKVYGTDLAEVADDDLFYGRFVNGTMTEVNTGVRLVRVTTRRDEGSNGVVPTTLARVLGINQMTVSATSAAALTPLSTLNSGYGDFPIGISKDWFTALGHKCGEEAEIKLFPTTTSCAALHTFEIKPPNKPNLLGVIETIKSNGGWTQPTVAGETKFEFIGGTLETVCKDIRDFVNWNKAKGKNLFNVPVYDDTCVHDNANKPLVILGFVQVEITNVYCQSDAKDKNKSKLDIKTVCGIVPGTVGSGGGANDYGLLSMLGAMVY